LSLKNFQLENFDSVRLMDL